MKLDIEKWVEEATPLSETGDILFEESVICYKNSAYRSAYLMSYLAFMITIKDRILKYEKCPNNVNVKYWEMVLRDLNDEQRWEETVLNLLQVSSNELNFLICSGNSSINDFDVNVVQSSTEELKTNWAKVIEKLDPENVDFDKKQKYTIEFHNVQLMGQEKRDSKIRRKADIFEISASDPDFSKQLIYFRTLRNQCAHGKSIARDFSASYVECLWAFMKNYLPKLRVGGTIEYWKEKIINCYLFYKDDLSLYETFFSELKVCSFPDEVLCEIWNELLDKMKLSYDFWEEEFIGDFVFLKYICENEWSRKSFLKCIKDDFALHETIYNTRFVLIYVNMKKYIEFYIKEDVTFWKGIVFDKIRETFQKKMEIYDYLFELWYDLVVDLNGNKEKQYMMISSLSLNALVQMEYEKHLDELRKIDYFYIMHKSIRLYDSISSSNYVAFSNYWRSDTDYKVWFLENVLEAVSDRNDTDIQLFKLKVGMFLKQIKKNSDNLPEYYMQKIAADNIIRCIESGKNTELYTYWEKVKEMTNK